MRNLEVASAASQESGKIAPVFSEKPVMAKPGIPVENPQRREVPEIPDPMPRRTPVKEPVPVPLEPRKPVPVGRV